MNLKPKIDEQVTDPIPPTTAIDLLTMIQEAGGEIRVGDPSPPVRASWRRVIYALINSPELLNGWCVRHKGRGRGDLTIRVVPIEQAPPAPPKYSHLPVPETLRGCHPIIKATREAAKKGRDGWINTRRVAGVAHLRIHEASLHRSLLLLQALANEAEHRGYEVGALKTYGCVGGFGIFINGHGCEIAVKEESQRIEHVLSTSELRDKERSRYFYAPPWDFLPTGRLQLRDDHDSYGSSLANDRQRWKVDDRLESVFTKLEERAAEMDARRIREEDKQIEAEIAWQEAMNKARVEFNIHRRAMWLSQQLRDYEESRAALGFIAEGRTQTSLSDDDRAWLDWVEQYAGQLNPFGKGLAPAPTPEPTPKDLEPFLHGFSPYGPTHR